MTFGKKAILAVFWNTFGNYIGFGISFISQLILIRILFPQDFGIFALATSIFEIFSILTSWSFSVAVIQMPEEDDLFDTAFYLSMLNGIILLILTLIISFSLNYYYPNIKELPLVFIYIGLCRAVSYISAIYIAHLEKNLKYKSISISRSIISVLSVFVAVISAIFGFGIWALVIRELISSFFNLIVFKVISKWTFKWKYNQELAKRLLTFSSKVLLSRGLEGAFYKIDSFLLGLIGGINILGYYSQSRYLADISHALSAPGTAIAAVPVYSKLQNEPGKLKEASRLYNYFLIRIMIPVSLIFLLFSDQVVLFLFGEKWLSASVPLKGLFLFPILVPVFENLKALLYGIGRIGTVAKIRLLQILISIPLLIFGFKHFYVFGFSVGFMMSILIGTIFIYFYSKRHSYFSFKENILFPFIAGVSTFLCVYFLKNHVCNCSGVMGFIGFAFLTITLYGGILFLIENKIMLENIKLIKRKII